MVGLAVDLLEHLESYCLFAEYLVLCYVLNSSINKYMNLRS